MPRLQILQHKSYHPYLQSNKDKVAKDEREEKERIEREELRVLQADSEARLSLLRGRDDPSSSASASAEASTSYLAPPPPRPAHDPFYAAEPERKLARKPKREKDDMRELDRRLAGKPSSTKGKDRADGAGGAAGGASAREEMFRTKEGHLNFWVGEEGFVGPPKPVAPPPPPKTQEEAQKDEPYTMYLSRTERELKPWYVDPSLKRYDERGEPRDEQEKRRREKIKRKDETSKTHRDPLTHITTLLSSHPRPNSHPHSHYPPPRLPLAPPPPPPGSLSPTSTRLAREASERARAQALIYAAKAKSNAGGSEAGSTPAVSRGSTVGGRTPAESVSGYEERRFFPDDLRRSQQGRQQQHGGRFSGSGLDSVRWDDSEREREHRRRRLSSSGGSDRSRDAGGRWREV